jgi:hypothetical protein
MMLVLADIQEGECGPDLVEAGILRLAGTKESTQLSFLLLGGLCQEVTLCHFFPIR